MKFIGSRESRVAVASKPPVFSRSVAGRLLREHVFGLLIAKDNVVHRIPAVLERNIVAVDVRREEDLWEKRSACCRRCMRASNKQQTYQDSTGTLGSRRGRTAVQLVSERLRLRKTGSTHTRRGGPSGSPMLIVVDSSLEIAVPGVMSV